MTHDRLLEEIRNEIQNSPERLKLFDKIGHTLLGEMRRYESRAGLLPQDEPDIKAVWVLSGSGSYFEDLLKNSGDQSLKSLKFFHGTDRARINYASKFINAYEGIAPFLFYNGTDKQNQDLIRAIKERKLNLDPNRVKIIDGSISSTLDQVRKFRYPAGIKILPSEKMAVLSHAPHFSRILRMMNRYRENFEKVKIVPISIKLDDPSGEEEFMKRELIGTLDYINRGEAEIDAYENKSL